MSDNPNPQPELPKPSPRPVDGPAPGTPAPPSPVGPYHEPGDRILRHARPDDLFRQRTGPSSGPASPPGTNEAV